MAAGSGARFGTFKQFEEVAGRRVVDWAVDSARSAADGVIAVLPATDSRPDLDVQVVVGGPTRSASVRAGLAATPADAEVIVIHDGARPAASTALFEAVIAAIRNGADAAIPGLPVTDTIKRVDGETVVETLDRETLVAAQTPQAFAAAVLRAAHEDGPEGTDDASLVEARGGRVVVVPGERTNLKITDRSDLEVVRVILETQQ